MTALILIAWPFASIALGLFMGLVCIRTRQARQHSAHQRGEGVKVRGGVQSHEGAMQHD